MTDHVTIGATPADEPCAQIGEEGYGLKALAECNRFRRVIRAALGPEPEGSRLLVHASAHDFGVYYEVAFRYDSAEAAHRAYAARCESREIPTKWSGQ